MSGFTGRSRARVARAKDKLRRGWGQSRLACAAPEAPLPATGPLPKCLLEPLESAPAEATPEEAAAPPSPPVPAAVAESAPPPSRRRFLQLSSAAGLAAAGGLAAFLTRPLEPAPPKRPVLSQSIDLPLSDTAYLEAPLPRRKPDDPPLGPLLSDRKLALYNENTGEAVQATFWAGGDYVLEELETIQWLLRDHHVDEMRSIDLKLLEVMFALQTKLGADRPLHVLSAYRTERTNAKLRGIYDGVALNSFHIKGQAVDIRLPGRGKRELYRAARALKAGGVGRYRSYIHIDTGPVRAW